jgi:hypothetical protein
MSNEFSQFVAGMRPHARAAANRDHTENIAWRVSQANRVSARRLRDI